MKMLRNWEATSKKLTGFIEINAHQIARSPIAIVAILALGACTTIKPTSTNIKTADGNSSTINLGGYRSKLPNTGYYTLLEKSTGQTEWSIKKFGTTPIRRTSSDQEVLYISDLAEWAQPAYDYGNATDNPYFNCMALKADGNNYSPCGASKFATVSEASTAFRNAIFIPLSMGAMAGTNRIINTPAISEALQQTGLIDQIKRINEARTETVRALNAADGTVSQRIASTLADARSLPVEATVINETGFPAPSMSNWANRINFLASNPASNTRIKNMFNISGLFDSPREMIEMLDQTRQKIKAAIESKSEAATINISCPDTTIGHLNAKFNCPEHIDTTSVEQKSPIPLKVIYASYNAGKTIPEISPHDKSINVSTKGGMIQIENTTSDFVEIHDVTCYVNNRSETKSWQVNNYLVLPPKSKLLEKDAIKLSAICAPIEDPLNFNRITLPMLTNRTVTFGIAVRYRKAGEATDHTLVDTKTFSVLELVRRQL